MCFNTLFKTDNGKSYSLVYWPNEESVSIVKQSDIILTTEPGKEVKVKVGRQVLTGILKLKGSIEEVRKAERDECKLLEEGRANKIEDKSNKSEKCSNRENSANTNKKKKEKAPGKILCIAPYNDTCDREASLPSATVEDEDETTAAVPEDMELSNSQNESSSSSSSMSLSDPLQLEITVQYLESQVELLVTKQAELVEQNKSLETRIYNLEMLILSNPSAYQLPVPTNNTHVSAPLAAITPSALITPDTPHTPNTLDTLHAQYTPNTLDTLHAQYTPNTLDTLHAQYTSNTLDTQYTANLLDTIDTHSTQHILNTSSSQNVGSGHLLSIQEVLQKYPKLQTHSNISRLAVKLAREAVFGPDIMAISTPFGMRGLKQPLPPLGLERIKNTLKSLFPGMWSNPAEYTRVWKTCLDAIGQACKNARKTL